MAFQFPASPTVGQLFTPSAGINFKWNGTAWFPVNSTVLTPTEADARYVQIANARSMESRIINGNFDIDQRRAGAAANVNTDSVYGMDRWLGYATAGAAFTMRRVPSSNGVSGFVAEIAVITPDAALAAGDYYFIGQRIEGLNIAGLNLGAAIAKPFTFACEIYSTVAGTLPISFRNGGTMAYVKTASFPANTLTPVVMTIPGAPSGTWNTTNGTGMEIWFGLGAGSAFSTTADAWQAGNFLTAPGCTNFMATGGTTLYICNARLYPGTVDYGPCRRLYADELRLCQRYYEKSYNVEVVPGAVTNNGVVYGRWAAAVSQITSVPFSVHKRAVPTVTAYSPVTGATGMWRDLSANADRTASTAFVGETRVNFDVVVGGANNVMLGHWTADAEL